MPNSADFNRFEYNPVDLDMNRSIFNMDHSVKLSGNCGDLIPFDLIEVMPGDTFEIDTTKVVRLQPMVAPIMDEVILDCYWFFVPHRLVWNHFKQFLGENDQSAWAPEVSYAVPKIGVPDGGFAVGSIADYLGIPPGLGVYNSDVTLGSKFNALPFRGYALICNDWFRSEALMDPVHVFTDDVTRRGVNTGDQVSDIELGGKPFLVCKFPDYFTSSLPSPQRGEPVALPLIDFHSGDRWLPVRTRRRDLSTDHPYYPDGTHKHEASLSLDPGILFSEAGNIPNNTFIDLDASHLPVLKRMSSEDARFLGYVADSTSVITGTTGIFPYNLWADLNPNIFQSVSVNDLRTAFAIQRYLEKQARYGGRYIEYVKAFFGTDSPDQRLQRPEYLGGSRLSLNINSVEQTSATESGSTPLGNVAGMSVTADQNNDFTKSFTEHGYIFGLCCLRYHHTYAQGVDRHFLYNSKYDFYVPTFANLGEMSVYGDELYVDSDDTYLNQKRTFGYQEAWSWLRYKPNRCAGEMRPGVPNTLDVWNLADNYEDTPTLSAQWIREDKSNLDRVLAVTSDVSHQFIADFFIKTKASRVMPLYSIPGLIDHH